MEFYPAEREKMVVDGMTTKLCAVEEEKGFY